MTKPIIAVGDYVTIEQINEQAQETGGLSIPKSQQNMLRRGRVLSVGEGKEIKRLGLRVGDIIIYNEIENNAQITGENFIDDGKEVYIIGHRLIYAREQRDDNT